MDWSAATENIRADLARLNDGVARDEQQLLEAFQKRLSDAERLNRGDAAGGVEKPPHPPFTSREYKKAGVPWFDYYRDDLSARPGSKALKKVKSVLALGKQKGEKPLPENDSVETDLVVQYGNARRPGEVREWVGQ